MSKNFQIKGLVNSMTRGKKFLMHNSMNIKNDNYCIIFFTSNLTCLGFFFFGLEELRVFHWFDTCLASGSYPQDHLWLPLTTLLKSLECFQSLLSSFAQIQIIVFWSCKRRRGTNFSATNLISKSSVKMQWHELQLRYVSS